jgi:hypothetical protein
MEENEIAVDEFDLIQPTRGERIKRSMAARNRRHENKDFKILHFLKEEKESQNRMNAKHRMEEKKKEKRKKLLDTDQNV